MEPGASAVFVAALLDELREVPGVLGCMLVGADGDLRQVQMPLELAGRARSAAPRLAVLLDALAAGRAVSSYCLRFFEHRLHVLQISDAYLCVLSELWSPSPVLKMAMNVTGRRLS
jgi:hypothetical protein